MLRLKQQHEVLATDLLVGYSDGYRRVDVANREDVDEAISEFMPGAVIHMAGEVGRLNGEQHPERMVRVNALGTMNVVRSCVKHGSKLINFSTSEVYGDAFDSHTPVTEESEVNAFGASNVYAISKMFGESIVKHYVENYGLKALTIRPFMLYGEGETPSKYRSALTNFVHAALVGRSFDVHRGTGRAWCHASDFAEGVALLVDLDSVGYQVFNIGSDEYHSMEEVARMVIRATGADSSLIRLCDPPEKFGTPVKRASIEKIKAIGFAPKVTLREGIARVVEWQRMNLPTH